jgi:uncharacterized protein
VPRFDPAQAGSGPQIRGFTASGQFVVDNQRYDAVLLTPERVIEWHPPPRPELTIKHLEPVWEELRAAKILLFGAGKVLARLPQPIMREFEEWGIGVEAMDSRAAARTWGVLRAEERWIVAALLPL